MTNKIKCCICGKEINVRNANNPYPLNRKEDDLCCGECNREHVIYARLLLSKLTKDGVTSVDSAAKAICDAFYDKKKVNQLKTMQSLQF